MWYIMLSPIIVYFITTKINCDTPHNNSDVIVTYLGHAEANYETPAKLTTDQTTIVPDISTTTPSEEYLDNATEDVMFIPNEKEVVRNYDNHYLDPNVMSVKDLVNKNGIGKGKVSFNTESPNEDIIFLSGKNNENVEKPNKKEKHEESRRSEKEIANPTKTLNCTKLDCNNTIKSVCGGKVEHKKWRYRLFRNECYYNKVNCDFRYDINRYHQVPLEKCKNVAAHYKSAPSYNPSPYVDEPVVTREKTYNHTRRNFASRRSQSMTINGQFCSHTCPVTCLDDYQPQCGISSTGLKRVFANHCKLDYVSCLYGIVWHMRPLSDCVGGKKADMRQNRGFIGWMQRVGIVDTKGRLVLSK